MFISLDLNQPSAAQFFRVIISFVVMPLQLGENLSSISVRCEGLSPPGPPRAVRVPAL